MDESFPPVTMDESFPEGMLSHIEGILAWDGEYPSGLDCYPHIFSSPLMYPLQREGEMVKMIGMARKAKPKALLDIGSDKGGGLYHWCKCLTTLEAVIACEIRGLPYAGAFERAFPHISFLWIEGSSYEPASVALVRDFLGGRLLDVAFLDGDKSNFDVDFNCYRALMREGGIVFVHDIQDTAPREGYEKILLQGFQHEEIIDKTDAERAVARKEQGIPPASPYEEWLRHWRGRSCGVGVIHL